MTKRALYAREKLWEMRKSLIFSVGVLRGRAPKKDDGKSALCAREVGLSEKIFDF